MLSISWSRMTDKLGKAVRVKVALLSCQKMRKGVRVQQMLRMLLRFRSSVHGDLQAEKWARNPKLEQ